MQVTKELIERWRHGEVITDEEAKALFAYYNGVRTSLLPCPPEYKLVLNDVRTQCDNIEEMLQARAIYRQRGKQWAQSHKEKVGSTVSCVI